MCGVVCGVGAGRDIVTGHFGIKRQQKKQNRTVVKKIKNIHRIKLHKNCKKSNE